MSHFFQSTRALRRGVSVKGRSGDVTGIQKTERTSRRILGWHALNRAALSAVSFVHLIFVP